MCVCVNGRVTERVCVCVSGNDRESVCVCEWEKESVWGESESERGCV